MSYDIFINLIGVVITFLSLLTYVVVRFAKLENEVTHIRADIEDFHDIKQMVYKIHAQNELLLSLRTSTLTPM